jgi:FkbM family methyltransferase
MRIAFTIIHNGLHHLKHNNQAQNILKFCDKWIVVEGAAKSNGSTQWCKSFPEHLHNNGASIDGTCEFLEDLSKQTDKLVYIKSNGFWNSKDDQVNRAIQEVKKITDKCFLWEIDADEQWTSEAMDIAEKELSELSGISATFRADCYVGKNLKALGEWGEAKSCGYIRLWKWSGQNFICHEPPILEGAGMNPAMLSPRFKHYNYYFKKDVIFKDLWYGGHEGILERWKLLNSLHEKFFPLHISNLITGDWGKSSAAIIYSNEDERRVVQIGANIGYDAVSAFLLLNKCSCIFVEPNPYALEILKECYKENDNYYFENVAVSNYNGLINMYFNDIDCVNSDSAHSSVSLNHVIAHKENNMENITTRLVSCVTIENLLKKYDWLDKDIEYLVMDTEGHDCDIILSTNFNKLKVKNVCFEITHSDGPFINGKKLEKTIEYLNSFGYRMNSNSSNNCNVTFTLCEEV